MASKMDLSEVRLRELGLGCTGDPCADARRLYRALNEAINRDPRFRPNDVRVIVDPELPVGEVGNGQLPAS